MSPQPAAHAALHLAPHAGLSPDPAPSAMAPAPGQGALQKAAALLARSRFFGRLSALIFLLAALAVGDSLQTLIRHEFNAIDLTPGESLLVSGMLPAKAKSHADLVLSIEGDPGLSFTPFETYKGFWMGGHMWRAELSAPPEARPGKAVITVQDLIPPPAEQGGEKSAGSIDERDTRILYGGKQNPALVFSVTLWASEQERRENDASLFRRLTGLPAFGIAVAAALLAFAAGFANWRTFSRAEKALAAQGVFFIHGLKDLPASGGPALSGFKAAFARAGEHIARGEEMILLDRDWKEQGRGRIIETDALKAQALIPHGGVRPRYGWLLMRSDTREK